MILSIHKSPDPIRLISRQNPNSFCSPILSNMCADLCPVSVLSESQISIKDICFILYFIVIIIFIYSLKSAYIYWYYDMEYESQAVAHY